MGIKERIKRMEHYKPPLEGRSEKDYLLLDFNERTVPVSPKVKEALKKFIDSDRLQVYPEYGDLEAKIAKYAGVKTGQVMVTNGADQGIDVICRAHLDEKDKVIIPFPSFAMHYQSAGIQGAEILEPHYGVEDGAFPLSEVLNLLEDEKVKLVIICNPNNPLGVLTPIDDIEKILKKSQEKEIAVLVDEACFDFCGVTVKDLIDKYDNLFIVRTFAKAYGLPSLRAGYVISQEENIQELKKIRGPYDVNMFAKTAILAALEDPKYFQDYIREVMEKSKPKLEKFLREKGIFFYPSQANFLLLRVENPQKLIEGLKSRGILVRPKPAPDGKIAIRVSIGTLVDTERFIEALDTFF
jgi:histidinol-phosphate aminotransferase